MGICGTAMGNVAVMMKRLGHEVVGADSGVYPPMSGVLAAAGIEVFDGYDAARLARLAPDFAVVGNALSRGNPEVEWLLETRALRYGSLPQLLHENVLARRRNIVVSGTHGKTTTTALCTALLQANGRSPGYLIGGVPKDLEGGAAPGCLDDPFVIEGDEYDSAFFDKRSKFIHYLPTVALVNNLEFDHADIFRDLADVMRTFRHFLKLVPRNGCIVANGDDANVMQLAGEVSWAPVVRVGVSPECDARIADFREDADGARFSLYWRGSRWAEVDWALPGLFNARNAAMAAVGAAMALFPENPTKLEAAQALKAARGVRRRQEILFRGAGCIVVEDFGHHPTAVAQTLGSLRARFPEHFILACFEPRSNTARTRVFQEALPQALSLADASLLGPVHRAEKLPPEQRLDLAQVARSIAERGGRCLPCRSNEQVLEEAWAEIGRAEKPILCVFFSNGAFGGVMPKLVERCQKGKC